MPRNRIPAVASGPSVALAAAFGAVLATASTVLSAGPANVTLARLSDVQQTRSHSAPASIVAPNAPKLAAEIDARVLDIAVDVGDGVSTTQVLLTLDCRRYEAMLGAARAAVDGGLARRRFAAQQLVRARDLRKKNSISEELLDQRQNELAVAAAELASARQSTIQAEIDVDNCSVRSPIDAVVTARLVSVGDYVGRGTPLLGLVETDGSEISAALRRGQIDTLPVNARFSFVSRQRRYPATLRALLPVADPVTRTQEVRLSFAAERAIVGSAGRLVWQGAEHLVPADLLVRRDGALGVFTVRDGRARFVALSGAEDGRPAPHGLPADTLLVVQGRHAIADGDPVGTAP